VNKAEDDLTGARTLAARPKPLKDIVCFHCQQAAEKYLKALLHELGITAATMKVFRCSAGRTYDRAGIKCGFADRTSIELQ
jgi:HEPN domain-containing protein